MNNPNLIKDRVTYRSFKKNKEAKSQMQEIKKMNSSDKETRPFFGPPLKASVNVEERIVGSKLVRSCHVTTTTTVI